MGFAASALHATLRPTFLLEEALYTEGPLFLLFTSLLFLCRRHFFFLLALAFSAQPPSSHHCMPVKRVALRVKMVKKGNKKMVLN
jgi:hypothetical protein